MPDLDDDEDSEDTQDQYDGDSSAMRRLRKQVEKLTKTNAELGQRASVAERHAAMVEAGIPKEGPGELFRKAYDGDLTAEAIKAAAERYGILAAPAEKEATEDTVAAHERVSDSSAGAAPPNAAADYEAEMRAVRLNGTQEQAYEVMRRYGVKFVDDE